MSTCKSCGKAPASKREVECQSCIQLAAHNLDQLLETCKAPWQPIQADRQTKATAKTVRYQFDRTFYRADRPIEQVQTSLVVHYTPRTKRMKLEVPPQSMCLESLLAYLEYIKECITKINNDENDNQGHDGQKDCR